MIEFFVLLPLSIWFLVFGFRLLFQKGYVEKKYGTITEQEDHSWFTKRNAYFYNKYVRGIEALALGGILLGLFYWIFLQN